LQGIWPGCGKIINDARCLPYIEIVIEKVEGIGGNLGGQGGGKSGQHQGK